MAGGTMTVLETAIEGLAKQVEFTGHVINNLRDENAELKAWAQMAKDALLCCDRYFNAQDGNNACNVELSRQPAVYKTDKVLTVIPKSLEEE